MSLSRTYRHHQPRWTQTFHPSLCHKGPVEELDHGVLLFICSMAGRTSAPITSTYHHQKMETLPSIGSQLKSVLQPVQKFVRKLTDILEQSSRRRWMKVEI